MMFDEFVYAYKGKNCSPKNLVEHRYSASDLPYLPTMPE